MNELMDKVREKKNLFLGILLAASAVTAWGSQSVVCRYIYGNEPETFDAATLAFYRFFTGGIVLLTGDGHFLKKFLDNGYEFVIVQLIGHV